MVPYIQITDTSTIENRALEPNVRVLEYRVKMFGLVDKHTSIEHRSILRLDRQLLLCYVIEP